MPISDVLNAATLTAALTVRAAQTPDREAFTFISGGTTSNQTVTFGALHRRATRLAALLHERAAAGERVLLVLPASLEFVYALFGCLYAGLVAVPAPAPAAAPNSPINARLSAIAADSAPAFVLCSSTATPVPTAGAPWIPLEQLLDESSIGFEDPALTLDTLAFLQYTSGSTSLPKGVMISHGNVAANHRVTMATMPDLNGNGGVGWLPMFHDMGLIGNLLYAIRLGHHFAFMSPLHFVQRPIRWLKAISESRAAWSGGPNFAFDFCVSRTRPEDRAGLDLSCWEYAFTGSEPIRAESLRRFCDTFEPYGFRASSLRPCFGLAEATLMVTCGSRERPLERKVSRRAYSFGRVEAAANDDDTQCIVSSGTVHADVQLEIVDPATEKVCVPGRVGEIWVAGASVSRGYWKRELDRDRPFGARIDGEGCFLRTGDLGFVEDRELFVSGRIKDIIIARGRKLHPNDVEAEIELGVEGVRSASACAFGVNIGEEEGLVVVGSVQSGNIDKAALVEAIRERLAQRFEIAPTAVVLIKPSSLPKTSSGKVQRAACKRAFFDGALEEVARWTSNPEQQIRP